MKLRSLLFTVFALCFVFNVLASGIGVEKARLVARNIYYEKANLYHGSTDFKDIIIKDTFVKGSPNSSDYYVFTFAGSGFVIVAGEDVISPLIGYSITGSYEDNDQPDSYRNFIQTYSDAIQFIRDNDMQQSFEVKALWEYYSVNDPGLLNNSPKTKSVDPLVQCKWNQGYPYNVYCPEDAGGPGGYVYSGCVATAMAQVMYYWRYPLQGTGSHTYYYSPYGNITANFGATSYQWEGMQNSISYTNPGPIAELQFHCGVGVDMMYGPGGSGAYSTDVPPALTGYFGYSTDCYFSWKDDHNNTEWVNMLKENIDNGWPMYYSGYSSAGGHAFVCDGYQDENFHFNFGWGGSSDGFYSLLSVNGFNEGQGAVFDTYPGSGYPYYFTGNHEVTNINGSITDGSGPLENYQNNVNCTWLISPQVGADSVSGIKIMFRSFETASNDFVTIYNGPTVQDEVLGAFSGSQLPPSIISTSTQVLIVFNTDGSETAGGWLIEFATIIPDFCKGLLTYEENSSAISDGSGNYNYHNGSMCMWQIIPTDAQSVTLTFSDFNTEANLDIVRIYDFESQELLATYSGSYPSTSLPAPVTSYSGKMFITFSTNNNTNFQGWHASYTSITTGINNPSDMESQFLVYPNPANDMISIKSPVSEPEDIHIKLISLTGLNLKSESINGSENNGIHQLQVSDVPKGIYLLQITGSSASEIKRIIIQ
jgi:hypothetical protein